MLESIIVAVAVILIIIAVLGVGIKKVNQYEKGIIERWHAYEKTVDPGLRYILPFVQRMFRIKGLTLLTKETRQTLSVLIKIMKGTTRIINPTSSLTRPTQRIFSS